MEPLLPYYERELSYLRRYSADFAERYPKIAGRLASEDESDDPHIAQLASAMALLNARIGKKIGSDFSHFLYALFDVLFPHYLRPFPACSIAQFAVSPLDIGARPKTVASGTELVSRAIEGVECRFKTVYDVTLAPLAIADARYLPAAAAPVVLPAAAAGVVSITFESTAPDSDLRSLDLRTVRVHLNGERSFIAALADGLLLHALTAYVEADGDGRWQPLRVPPVEQSGFAESDALLDYPLRSHPAYRLLSEYFGFPEKFDFVDIGLGAMLDTAGPCRRIALHLVLKEGHGNPHAARLLESLSAAHFKLFATPIVNLFRRPGEPVRVTHHSDRYPVIADARHAAAYDIYSIDSVTLVRQTRERETCIELRPFYSLRYGDEKQSGHYWFARRDEAVAQASPGYETEISVVEVDFDPLAEQTDTLSLNLTCTNRDLPSRLAVGLEGGDLFLSGDQGSDAHAVSIAMLRRPTRTLRFDTRDGLSARLASLLPLNHVSLAHVRVAVLRVALALYDLQRSAVTIRHVGGIHAVESRDATVDLPGKPYATSAQGVEVRLTIDEARFVGTSIAAFVGAINAFLGYYVHLNSFVQLTVVSKQTGLEIVRCKPRSSDWVLP